jgi:hypothetical protein
MSDSLFRKPEKPPIRVRPSNGVRASDADDPQGLTRSADAVIWLSAGGQRLRTEVNRHPIMTVALAVVMTLLIFGGIASIFGVIASRFSSPETVVKDFLDAKMQGKETSRFGSENVLSTVTDYVVKGYEVKNVSGETVSVTIIFESQAHTDLRKTRLFTVSNGVIGAIK